MNSFRDGTMRVVPYCYAGDGNMMERPIFSTEIAINGLNLKNRFVMCSMVTNYAAGNGEVTDELIRYHEERARGGCALNMLEATYISREGNSYFRGVGISDDYHIPGLKRLTDAVHACGGKIGVQLQHGGRTARPAVNGQPMLLVSCIPGITAVEESREMTADDIHRLVESYRRATVRAMAAGFDAVEIHAAHGYLLAQFLSPHTNRRTDDYGGSPENRLRFPMEVMDAVREAAGPEYPVIVRLSVEEFVEPGITLESAAEAARMFVEHGADALSVSVGTTETNCYTIPPSCIAPGWNAERAAAIGQAVGHRVPVIVAGRINNVETAERILENGQADIIGMGRALYADPSFPAKALAGEDGRIRPCVACNEGCVGAMARCEPTSCAVNPRAGYEHRYPFVPAKKLKKVLVVGGGIAGMYAAETAARRGHSVTLWERANRLGGLLNIAAIPPHKALYRDLIQSFSVRLAELKVAVKLNMDAVAKDIAAFGAEEVLIATGSVPFTPLQVQGVAPIYAEDVLKGAQTGRNVVILGGGLVGCETAEFLAVRGKSVTVIELRDEVAADMEVRSRRLLLERLADLGVTCLVKTQVCAVDAGASITVVNPFGRKRVLSGADSIISAFGYRSNTELYEELEERGVFSRRIGDCLSASNVRLAMRNALETAYSL